METGKESPDNGASEATGPKDPPAMAATRKFLFDTDFDEEEPPEEKDESPDEEEAAEPEVIVPTFSEEEMQAAREESFAAGKAEGVSEAAEATERRIADLLEKLNQQFGGLFRAQEEADTAILENAIAVACGIVRKVFPALNDQGGLAEVERIVAVSLEKVLEEPEVTLSVNPDIEAALNQRLGTLVEKAGYKGTVKIVADESLDPGDCRLEWGGGGAKRDMNALWQEIDEIVERNLSGQPDRGKDTPERPAEAAPAQPEHPPEQVQQAPDTPAGEDTPTGQEDT